MRKWEKEKRKEKEKGFSSQLGRGGGGISAQVAQARAGGRAFGPLGPAARGDGGETALRRGPARQRGGGTTLTARREGWELDRSPVGGEPRGGSPLSVRFCGGETVAKHGRLMGVTGVGRILPAGAYGGRSAARRRVPAAVLPPVRLPATIEGEKWRPVIVGVWRSFWHSLIGQRIAREGEGSSPER
jgi:hypothetical protein